MRIIAAHPASVQWLMAPINIECLIAEAVAARAKAMSEKGGAAAGCALTVKAKLTGMWRDRAEQHVTGNSTIIVRWLERKACRHRVRRRRRTDRSAHGTDAPRTAEPGRGELTNTGCLAQFPGVNSR